MKNSFMVMALRCLSMTVSNHVSKSQEGDKFLLLDDAISYSELSARYRWLAFVNQYQYTLKMKNKMPINNLHLELQELMKTYPELQDYSLNQGDPFPFLINKNGLTLDEIIKLHGEQKTCVNINRLEEIVTIISEYNFYYQYKKIFSTQFKHVERDIEKIAKRDHWPGRGSWNSFVPKTDKPKKDFNIEFLSMYRSKSTEIDSTKEVDVKVELNENL